LLLPAVRVGPLRDAARARGRAWAAASPPQPDLAAPPADALPRLRRADNSLRICNGRAALPPHRRALDRRDAPLDAGGVGISRRRAAARGALGVRRDRLGRLLRVGSGRERGADALARGDRVLALGDDPGGARDA